MSTPEFFQAGRTYTDGNGFRAPELTTNFHVEHVTRHPESGQLRAIGWSKTCAPDQRWHGDFRDEDEFSGWAELDTPLLPEQPIDEEGKGTGTTGGEPTPPSRFMATPLDVDVFLRQNFAEDVYLRYQQVIGNISVSQAARDARMDAALRQVEGEESMAEMMREVADFIDPRKSGGPYPAALLCSQHNGFGPCPGAPQCGPGLPDEQPKFFEIGTSYRSKSGVFQCHAVTRHPGTGERRALGWQFRERDGVHQWVPAQLDPDDYAVGGWDEIGGSR